MENASDDFPQQKKLENLLPNFAGSSPPISPKTSPTSHWKSLVLNFRIFSVFFRILISGEELGCILKCIFGLSGISYCVILCELSMAIDSPCPPVHPYPFVASSPHKEAESTLKTTKHYKRNCLRVYVRGPGCPVRLRPPGTF